MIITMRAHSRCRIIFMKSSMKQTRDICVGEKYIDKYNQEKTAWHKIGTLFLSDENENRDLKISGILKSCPIGSGSFAAFVPKPREGATNDRQQAPQYQNGASQNQQSISRDRQDGEEEIHIEDVPF